MQRYGNNWTNSCSSSNSSTSKQEGRSSTSIVEKNDHCCVLFQSDLWINLGPLGKSLSLLRLGQSLPFLRRISIMLFLRWYFMYLLQLSAYWLYIGQQLQQFLISFSLPTFSLMKSLLFFWRDQLRFFVSTFSFPCLSNGLCIDYFDFKWDFYSEFDDLFKDDL